VVVESVYSNQGHRALVVVVAHRAPPNPALVLVVLVVKMAMPPVMVLAVILVEVVALIAWVLQPTELAQYASLLKVVPIQLELRH
jgi:hypothetical protein